MPQLNPDEAANDEPKTYNDEAIGGDDGWQDSNDLNDIKDDLVDEDDGNPIRQSYDSKVSSHRNGESSHRNKDDMDRDHSNDMGAARPNFPYPQQDLGSIVSGFSHPLFSKVVLPPSSQVPYSPYMGPYVGSLFPSPIDIDGKQGPPGRTDVPQMYSLPGQLGQIPNPLSPWSAGPLYPLCTASAMAGMLRYPYPFHNFSSTSGGMGSVSPFPLVPPHPHAGGIHPNMLQHGGGLSLPGHMMNGQNGGKPMGDKKNSSSEQAPKRREKSEKSNRPYVKKPLNAFMIYMKEQRAQVVAECTLKESAAINQILGRKWHSLNRDEQQKYYEMARKERQLHMQMFPGWSARDNYGKRKKRKKEKAQDCTAQNPKKCRAVFGLEQQQLWCAPCRRKKKCIRYQHDGDDSDDSDASPGQYQASPESSYCQNIPNQSNTFDVTEQSVISSSSGVPSSNCSNQSGSSLIGERLSPGQSVMTDQIKQEKSPPLPIDANAPPITSKGMEMFHPPTSDFQSSANDGHHNNGNSMAGNCAKRPRTNENPSNFHGKNRDFPDNPRFNPSNMNGLSAPSKTGAASRHRRSNSHAESPMNSRQQNMFNSPMLSPTGMGLNSPHANTHPALFPQFTYLAAAASLPTSPLGGLMGFPGFKGLASPVGMGLNGPGSSVAPGGHPGSSASRHATSALEGKS